MSNKVPDIFHISESVNVATTTGAASTTKAEMNSQMIYTTPVHSGNNFNSNNNNNSNQQQVINAESSTSKIPQPSSVMQPKKGILKWRPQQNNFVCFIFYTLVLKV